MNSVNSFFGLTCNPFSKQGVSAKDFFPSRDFQEMHGALDQAKDVRGIAVFTSPPGAGKTFALRVFSQELNPNLYNIAYICLSTVSIAEFYKQFCGVLGIPPKGGKPGMFKAIQEQIWYLYKEKRQPLILVVDEAQYLNTAILNDLKMLMNYDYDSLNCFTLILCGESYLNNTLRKPVHEALRQRITIHYEFQGLSDEEVPAYVRHKIRYAGGSEQIINEAAMSALNSMSQNNPRVIDNIMSDALTIAMQAEKHTIDADVILAAVNHQSFA
ncbi:MAG: ExeA family protein [Mogibacterium sp.]|nr:ExeA family protein [Mogibacterium sp.]